MRSTAERTGEEFCELVLPICTNPPFSTTVFLLSKDPDAQASSAPATILAQLAKYLGSSATTGIGTLFGGLLSNSYPDDETRSCVFGAPGKRACMRVCV